MFLITLGGVCLMEHNCKKWGHLGLRLTLGLLFLVPGLMKLVAPSMITGFLASKGFPAAGFLAWVLILAEVICGALILVGYKVKWAVIPPIVVLVVAILTVHLGDVQNPMRWIDVLFRLVGITGLLFIGGAGAGEYAVDK